MNFNTNNIHNNAATTAADADQIGDAIIPQGGEAPRGQPVPGSEVPRSVLDDEVAREFPGISTYPDLLDHCDREQTKHLGADCVPEASAQRRAATYTWGADGRIDRWQPVSGEASGPAVVRLEQWFQLVKQGALGAWNFQNKGKPKRYLRVRAILPGRGGSSHYPLRRVLTEAAPGQLVELRDGNPLNHRGDNLVVRGGGKVRVGNAKTHTAKRVEADAAKRDRLAGRNLGPHWS